MKKKYLHLQAWHYLTGSYQYYVEQKVEQARRDDAPDDAVYYDLTNERWVRFIDVTNQDMIARVERWIAQRERTNAETS